MKKLTGRRGFIKKTAAGIAILNARSALGTAASSTVNLGVIGCGSRGNHVGGSFMEHTNTRVTAIADLFEDKLA